MTALSNKFYCSCNLSCNFVALLSYNVFVALSVAWSRIDFYMYFLQHLQRWKVAEVAVLFILGHVTLSNILCNYFVATCVATSFWDKWQKQSVIISNNYHSMHFFGREQTTWPLVLKWWHHKLNFQNYGICWDILKEHDEKWLLAKNQYLIPVGLGGGDTPQKNWIEVCGLLPKTLTLFMTKICNFPYPIYDLIKNLIPYLWPDSVQSTSFEKPLEPRAWPEHVTSRCGTYTVAVNIMMKK